MNKAYNPNIHKRKSTRLKGYDYSSAGGYFVTICLKDRKCLFGEIINGEINLSEIGQIAYNNWSEIPNYFKNVEIDEFVIMPNHIHGIILINSENNDLIKTNDDNRLLSDMDLIHQIPAISDLQSANNLSLNTSKTNISGKYNLMLDPDIKLGKIIRHYKAKTTNNIRKNKNIDFQWQRNYHEWIIKNENHLERFRNYIYQNPLKWEIDSENPMKNDSDIPNNGRGLIHQTLDNKQPKKNINHGTNKNEQK